LKVLRGPVVLPLLLAAGSAGFLASCGSTGGLSGKRAAVVEAGLSQVGTAYVYGGSRPGRGLDCSGLTQYAYRAAGVRIPRESAEQWRMARRASSRHPRPGDMVFFEIRPGAYHVGLMVDSNHFVHASTSDQRVRMSDLRSSYWQAHYIGAGTYLD
jgi:cell wall-associated NlpC family hydrolase